MGKINNIKMKAKKAVVKLAQQVPQKGKQHSTSAEDGDKVALQLHKTNTPRKTISKKEKSRQKHKNLLGKFAAMKKKHKEEVARKNREKAAVVGDLKPLKDALPSLSELFELTKTKKDSLRTGLLASQERNQASEEETPKKLSAKQKLQNKKAKFLRQVTSYEALLQDPEFKSNPREAIAYHVKYTNGLIDRDI